jgi:L-rhamnose isomerase/sugar isomerase
VKAEREGIGGDIVYMIDEGHTLKDPIEETIQSLVALQTAYAKALIVDYDSLKAAQSVNDLISSEEIIKDAFDTDVRPILAQVRQQLGIPDVIDPVAAFRQSGFRENVSKVRTAQFSGGLGVQ